MIRQLRKVPSNWFGLLTVLVGLSAGMGMVRKTGGGTWLCQDGGCVSVQGYTIIVLSVISGCWLIYEEIRRLLRLRHIRKLKLRKANSEDS
jgi:uncharacterized membrane protein YcjF (UPF0283 family)